MKYNHYYMKPLMLFHETFKYEKHKIFKFDENSIKFNETLNFS